MKGISMYRHRSRRRQRGQIVPITALAMIALIGGVALILEGGNAYAHQREAQNGADAVANAGAAVLAQYIGGTSKTDTDVEVSMHNVSNLNYLNDYDGYYTNVTGNLLTPGGATTTSLGAAARVGDGVLPPSAQGVQAFGTQTFTTTFGRVIGFPQFTATADAISVAGALSGGVFLPVVFPVNIVDCEKNGDLGTGEVNWQISNPDGNDADTNPDGQEYIVPLCKTGGGSFMILDLDGTPNNCDDEVKNPPAIQFATFPVDVQSDNGNNCAKKMVDEVNAKAGQVVLIPVCDGDCVTGNGSNAVYHVIRVAAFYLDYMSDQNGGMNTACQGNGTTLVPIRGNGSSSCLAGWFVRYITSGPVGAGSVQGAGAIGIQLVK
ncbi:MAG: pilus assembly protein TadG-related protein [Chloroflexota bacterium]